MILKGIDALLTLLGNVKEGEKGIFYSSIEECYVGFIYLDNLTVKNFDEEQEGIDYLTNLEEKNYERLHVRH